MCIKLPLLIVEKLGRSDGLSLVQFGFCACIFDMHSDLKGEVTCICAVEAFSTAQKLENDNSS